MRISIVGAGYVGLVSGACLASRGHEVICVDVNSAKVAAINSGDPTIHENGLPDLLERSIGRTLRATTDLRSAVLETDVTMIAVGTPARGGRIDLSAVRKAASDIGAALREKPSYHAVIVKSTVVPGTTDRVVAPCLEASSERAVGADLGLGMNPEFLTEGQAVKDFLEPDRIVLGGRDGRTHEHLRRIYASFSGVPTLETNNTTAEFIKYASNAVLATMISFANEMSRLCMAVGDVDVADVMKGVHESSYFSSTATGGKRTQAGIVSFLAAGCGFGGSCLPKDVMALVGQGETQGLDLPLLKSVLMVNRSQPDELVNLLRPHFASLKGLRIALLGIAFKPDTDDTRESPAFAVAGRLVSEGALVTAFDPVARLPSAQSMPGTTIAATLEDAVRDADAIVIVTRWSEFGRLPDVLGNIGCNPLVVDGRRMLDPASLPRYEGIGRAVSPRRPGVQG